jgi:glycosyltransferase involved in cell wall biosynthesis
MKLIIFIPALNEEKTISNVILAMPKKISGIDEIKILVIDDGSKDKTVEIARNAGADKIISHSNNMGIGAAFMTGIRNCISMNADVAVIIDADLQFNPNEIPKLLLPILNNQLDVVLGSRWLDSDVKGIPTRNLIGNKICTKLISLVTGQKFTDTQSGFVAYSKNALSNISVVNDFTFVHEAILDLKFKGFRIGEIGVSVKYFGERKSRVVKNIFNYGYRSLSIILKSLVYHRPILTFGLFGITLVTGGIIAKIITVSKYFGGGVSSDLSSGVIILGIVSFMLGIFANVVFKRQAFAERNLRYYFDNEKIKREDS